MPRAFRFHVAAAAAVMAAALVLPTVTAAQSTSPGIFRADAFRDAVERDTTFRPVTHRIELRFGMSYSSDEGLRPGYGARYTMTLNHQLDNGWQVSASVGVSLDNLNTPAPWRDRAIARY